MFGFPARHDLIVGLPEEWEELSYGDSQQTDRWLQGPNSGAMKAYEDCF